jgi:hypothetical protein
LGLRRCMQDTTDLESHAASARDIPEASKNVSIIAALYPENLPETELTIGIMYTRLAAQTRSAHPSWRLR